MVAFVNVVLPAPWLATRSAPAAAVATLPLIVEFTRTRTPNASGVFTTSIPPALAAELPERVERLIVDVTLPDIDNAPPASSVDPCAIVESIIVSVDGDAAVPAILTPPPGPVPAL